MAARPDREGGTRPKPLDGEAIDEPKEKGPSPVDLGARKCVVPRCNKPAAYGTSSCREHFGAARLVGYLNPLFKARGPMRRRFGSEAFQERFDEFLKGKALFALEEDAATLEVMIESVCESLEAVYSTELVSQMAEQYRQVMMGGPGGMVALTNLGKLIEHVKTGGAGRQELKDLLEQKRRLVETHVKKQLAETASLRADEAITLVMALVAAVNENVFDVESRKAIQAEFARVLYRAGLIRPGAGGGAPALEPGASEPSPV